MTIIRNSTDAFVSESTGLAQTKKRRLYLAADASTNTRYSYHYFGLPSGLAGCLVPTGKLVVFVGQGDWAGTIGLTARLLSEKFNLNTLKWAKKPGVTGPVASTTVTGATDGTRVEINIQPLLQQVADGTSWFGLRLETTTGTNGRYIYSAEADENLRPYLEFEYKEYPEAPDGLWPADGRAVSVTQPVLRWNYLDENGESSQVSFDIRFFATEAAALANTTPTWSATHSSTQPEANLATLGYSGLAADQSVWWIVRVTNDSGQISDWSAPANFVRKTKGTVAINNPAASPNNVVTESTPPFSWSFTGRTQKTYRVTIEDVLEPLTRFWTSGPITSSEVSVTPPEGLINKPGGQYRVIVEILDDIPRASTPGDDSWAVATRQFSYTPSTSVETVTGLTSTQDSLRPHVTLNFSRATAPDQFVIIRDGVEIDSVDSAELFVSGTSYRYVDRSAPLARNVTWNVAAKVNRVTSADNPATTRKVRASATYLCTEDGSREVFLLNRQRTGSRTDSSAIHRPLGGPPVVIFQALGGYEGKVSGVMVDESGLTALEQMQDLEWMRKNRGIPVLLTWTDRTLRVIIFNVETEPVSYPDGTVDYVGEFEFVEV